MGSNAPCLRVVNMGVDESRDNELSRIMRDRNIRKLFCNDGIGTTCNDDTVLKHQHAIRIMSDGGMAMVLGVMRNRDDLTTNGV
ncbi:hypothetical protein GbCGDNIH4_8207 [Granulibacter bethesdensis CGDNIH4]|nr:hypothetical protein GbCGDNIH4_8207 [Granulibacter bethesdensis CGDNIH4]